MFAGVVATRGDQRDGGDGERRHGGEQGGASGRTACHASRLDQRAEGDADLQHHPRDEDHAPDAGGCGERSGRLGDAEAGEGHAAEREREPQRLHERVGERADDHRPPHRPVVVGASACRDGQLGDAVPRRVHHVGGDVARRGQLPHPGRAGGQPGEGEQEAEGEARPARRRVPVARHAPLEQGDADERQRPPAPRRQRQRDDEARRDCDERSPRQAAVVVSGASVVVVRGGSGGTGAGSTVDREEVEVGDDALRHRARRMTGEQRGLVAVALVDDPDGIGGHDLDRAHVVHVDAADAVGVGHARRRDPVGVVHVEDHLVAGLQLVEATEVGVVARAVAGDDHVAQLTGHRRARPVAGAVVERRQADALEERRVDIDRRDLQAPEVLLRLGVVVERGRDRDRQRHQRGGRGGGRGVGGGGGIGSRGGGRLGRQRASGLAVLQRFGDRAGRGARRRCRGPMGSGGVGGGAGDARSDDQGERRSHVSRVGPHHGARVSRRRSACGDGSSGSRPPAAR